MIHMNDGCHVRLTTEAADWKLVTVHDSFGSAAGNYFATNELLAEMFAELHRVLPSAELAR